MVGTQRLIFFNFECTNKIILTVNEVKHCTNQPTTFKAIWNSKFGKLHSNAYDLTMGLARPGDTYRLAGIILDVRNES